jgi:hypothetical protein
MTALNFARLANPSSATFPVLLPRFTTVQTAVQIEKPLPKVLNIHSLHNHTSNSKDPPHRQTSAPLRLPSHILPFAKPAPDICTISLDPNISSEPAALAPRSLSNPALLLQHTIRLGAETIEN